MVTDVWQGVFMIGLEPTRYKNTQVNPRRFLSLPREQRKQETHHFVFDKALIIRGRKLVMTSNCSGNVSVEPHARDQSGVTIKVYGVKKP
ncbi:hypothetical protein NPIL_367561 [Nephila pilipes]|uniref:Uncharacterized protein n=1 Tax=Nephila pilipes TaxID=299642 RepID=A0A8X6TBE6_NEPPI|nr:hypothetical protein NPIL_367561 [Nephila pilipes]